jgi:histone deacetylase complex subunit SAP30
LTVDFTKLDMATLKRYKRHYRLKTRQNVTKTELALAVAKHFALQTVDEADTISLFMYSARAGSLQYDRRDYLNGR